MATKNALTNTAEHASTLTAECTETSVTAADVTYTKDEISPIIQKCIQVALKEFEKQHEEKLAALNIRLTNTETLNRELKARLDAEEIKRKEEAKVASKRLCQLEKDVLNIQKELRGKQVSSKHNEIEINDLEQYSRRSHLRIRGLHVQSGENYKSAVARLCSTKLQVPIKEEDLDAAHPLPQTTRRTSSKQAQQQQQQPPNIIARFHQRDQRDAVIKARALLKNSKIVVSEDLTAKNQDLLKRLHASNQFTSSWSWMGKIYAIPRGANKAKKISIKDTIPSQ